MFVKDLRKAYEQWCDDQGEEPAQGRTFNRMMEERGYERRQATMHGKNAKAWHGIRLKDNDELVETALPSAGVGNRRQGKYKTVFNGGVTVQ